MTIRLTNNTRSTGAVERLNRSGNSGIARMLRQANLAGLLLVAGVVTPALAETFSVALSPVADEKAVFATVESRSVVPARSRIGGTVAELHVREGDSVTRGQVVAVVADEKLALQMKSLDAQIAALQAQYDQANIDFTRTEGLVDRGILPRTKLDETRTALNVAENGLRARKAERDVVQQQFNEGQVLAPSDGRILKRMVSVGSVMLPGDTVEMVAQQDFKLRLRIPERHARFLKVGDNVRIDSAETGERTSQQGTIDLVYPQIEDGRVVADAKVDGLGEYFVGDRLRVWISGGTRPAFIVPASYITTRFGIDYVSVQSGTGAISVPVQRGRPMPSPKLADGIEILSGVQSGDILVQP